MFPPRLCISVKLKNLKANHNVSEFGKIHLRVVYIRKVKKSESKSQLAGKRTYALLGLYISVKLKNLKANHNLSCEHRSDCAEIIGIIANIPLYNFEHNRNIAIFAAPNNTQYEV